MKETEVVREDKIGHPIMNVLPLMMSLCTPLLKFSVSSETVLLYISILDFDSPCFLSSLFWEAGLLGMRVGLSPEREINYPDC